MCFWHRLFSTFSNMFLEHLQWKPIQTACPSNFSRKEATETNSNNMLSSNCCFLFEKCAREAASLGAPGHVHRDSFSLKRALFWQPCSGPFFLKNDAKWNPIWHHKSKKMWSKTKLEMKWENYSQNMLKWMPLDLRKTSFQFENVQKVTKPKNVDKGKMFWKVQTMTPKTIH